jgi:uncharacterized repeat protein (TIGR03803 family)
MENSAQHRGWISGVLVVMLVLKVFAAQSAQGQTFTVLYNFPGSPDWAEPYAGLFLDTEGNLYGTTAYGGNSDCGTVYELSKTGEETILYNFCSQTNCTDGEEPQGGVIRDAAGNSYGTTILGGAYGDGTVFEVSKTGSETVLHSFGYPDGVTPRARLIRDKVGNLYGTTTEGGTGCGNGGCGVVFKVAVNGTETVLHSFNGSDGAYPTAGLVRDVAGNFYGTTYAGGTKNYGTVFKLSKTGKLTVLHSFTESDGANPDGDVIRDAAGNFYGTTYAGGASNVGTVFKLSRAGKETVLHSFGYPNGAYPTRGLVQDIAGNFYGTTYYGGGSGCGAGCGVVFKVSKTGEETVVHSFAGYPSDGGYPFGGLIRDAKGNIYGTTVSGGIYDGGTVWKLTP